MKTTVKSRPKIWLTVIGILTALFTVVTLINTWISYPTAEHRDVARQTEQVLQKNGGSFNLSGYDTKEYKDLVSTDEATYSSNAIVYTSIASLIIYVIIIGKTYNYLRRNNVSASKRTVGLTALLALAASAISTLLTIYPFAYFTGVFPTWDGFYLLGMLLSSAVAFFIYFIIASLFEIVYNKRNSFLVD